MDRQMDRRQQRLASEFTRMKALIGPYNLFSFVCAEMNQGEAAEFLKAERSFDVISETIQNHLTVAEYEQRFPDSSPDKYMISYSCTGLLKKGDDIEYTNQHFMSVIFGYDFPGKPPKLIWYTPIWHPNFLTPYVCTQGRPFAAAVHLDRIVRMVGEMVQYRNYNLDSVLNREAKVWTEQNRQHLPVDNRDIVDSRLIYKTGTSEREDPLVELIDADLTGSRAIDGLLELID